MKELPPKIFDQIRIALGNLDLAQKVTGFLSANISALRIPTTVEMRGPANSVIIPGENCGFFTTPVVHSAILDIRRFLNFLCLKYSKSGALEPMERKPFPDDYWIKDVPLEPVRIEMIESTALSICGERTSNFLREVIVYANKQMAHFSEHNQLPDIGSIQKSCRLMSEIVLVHVFDALGTPRP